MSAKPDGEPRVQASDVMHAPVFGITADKTAEEAINTLFEHAISALPVVDGAGSLVGIVTKTDLLRYQAGSSGPTLVGDIMTRQVMTIFPETDVDRAAAIMSYEGVHRVVVVSVDNKPIGIVSSIDILRAMARTSGYVVPDSTRPQME